MALQPEPRENNAMNLDPKSILHVLPTTDLERLLGASKLYGYLPFVTLRVARDEHGLSLKIVVPDLIGATFEADEWLTGKLGDLKVGQSFDLTIDADGNIKHAVDDTERTINLLHPLMIQVVNSVFYAELVILASGLRTFLLDSLPNIKKLRADVEGKIEVNLNRSFYDNLPNGVVGARCVRVVTPGSLERQLRQAVFSSELTKTDRGYEVLTLVNKEAMTATLAEHRWQADVIEIQFGEKYDPKYSDLSAEIVRVVAETMLPEANVKALTAFGSKIGMWKRMVEIELDEKLGGDTSTTSTNPANDGESDYNEPAAGELGQHPPSEAALPGSVPDEN